MHSLMPKFVFLLSLLLLLRGAPTLGMALYAAKNDDILLSRRQCAIPILSGCLSGCFISSSAFADPVSSAAPAAVAVPGVSSPRLVSTTIVDSTWSPPPLTTNLAKTRIMAKELSPISNTLLPFADRELYYPEFLFGAWNVTATLERKEYPYGLEYVPSFSLIEGSPRNRMESVGDITSGYELHYFSTLADTASNQAIVNLGLGVPKSRVIADRSFNTMSTSKAYKQLAPVQSVEWDPRKDPTRLTLEFSPGAVAEDMRPLGQRRGEVYITARQSEDGIDKERGTPVFGAAERTRSVTLAPGNVIVSDSESITEFRQAESPSHVVATSRIAVYLTPNPNSREGILWQQVGGKAIAFLDYEIDMRRIEEEFTTAAQGTKQSRACVKTPKDVIQCS